MLVAFREHQELREETTVKGNSFDRLASTCAYIAAAGGILYAFSFVILYVGGRAPVLGLALSSVFLLLGGLLASVILVAIYRHVLEVERSLALWALALGLLGALGSTLHAGYDLANVLHPPSPDVLAASGYPNPIDPPPGCTFHPRCAEAMPACRERAPVALIDAHGRVECHLYDSGVS